MKLKSARILIAGLAVLAAPAILTACQPTVSHRGYMARPGAFDQIVNGMSKTEVEGLLGSPSTTASIKLQADSYYYITSVSESRAFLAPKETSREVIAIRFDGNDQVESFGQYGLDDGRIININDRRTPVLGEDLSILQQIFRNLLNTPVGPGGNVLQRKI